jgi:hypothetical protein
MKTGLTILLLISFLSAQSQVVYNNLLVKFNFTIERPLGGSDLKFYDTTYPKFFPNMHTSIGGEINGTYLFSGNFGVGLSIGGRYLTGWNYGQLDYYKNATSIISSFSPLIYYQTPALLNKSLRFYVDCGPLFTGIKVNLEHQIFSIENYSGKPLTRILSSRTSGSGVNLSCGLIYYFSKKTAISINMAYRYLKMHSVLYTDTNFSSFSTGAGIIIMFLKDKKYYY